MDDPWATYGRSIGDPWGTHGVFLWATHEPALYTHGYAVLAHG